MRKFTPFETAILGFFVGVIVAVCLAFFTSSNMFLGQIIRWVSLLPAGYMLGVPVGHLVYEFLFVVLVYTFYGFVIGAVLQFTITDKTKLAAGLMALVFLGMGTEQYFGMVFQPAEAEQHIAQVFQATEHARSAKEGSNKTVQYFGTEAHGDLNADGKDDVAFLIPRNDETRGTIYYLSTALATDAGYTGTNLLFLGDEVTPKNISIKDGVIDVEYAGTHMYRRVVNGVLEKVQ
jgi:hypothetical protein